MDINKLLQDYSLIDTRAGEELRELVNRHPWFTLGRYMLTRSTRDQDHESYARYMESLCAKLFINPYPLLLLDDAYLPDPEYHHLFDGYEMIDEFMANPNVKITAGEDSQYYSQEDISLDSVSEDQELISETLARIYLRQGHVDKAVDIYYKLSLKYPEKSTYFANLIDNINS